MIAGVILLLLAGPTPEGLLSVKSNLPGITLYLDGDYIGRAPVENHAVQPGSYNLSIISNDSLDNIYWRLRQGKIGQKLSSFWTLVAVNAGTYSVDIRPGEVTEVFIDYGRVANARNEAKLIACGSTGGLFLFGAIIGFLIGWLSFR